MFLEKKKPNPPIPATVKQRVFERSKGRCENPKCHNKTMPLKWKSDGTTIIRGQFHHTGDPSKTPTSRTVRFLCPNCHSIAHRIRTVRKQSFFGSEKRERKVIREKFIQIRKKKEGKKLVSYQCQLPRDRRTLQCGKKKADKSCLKASFLIGKKCRYLIISKK